jgi:hypothetical protein
MQTRGTFPELNTGTKKSSPRKNGKFSPPDKGMSGFVVGGRLRSVKAAPKGWANRRAASHAKANGY